MNLLAFDYSWFVLILLPVVVFMYATVGHGRASGYLALMVILVLCQML